MATLQIIAFYIGLNMIKPDNKLDYCLQMLSNGNKWLCVYAIHSLTSGRKKLLGTPTPWTVVCDVLVPRIV